ncbi:LOW QUALITY PROTEIN: hypothetical protein PoB_001236700 [Plakobranchus ocellatus]|uniref:Uncharacterized protein n=1 Tax=Plakobranchus ocellatus TaxID=259542 RepID=A0AAV3YSF1_9GAST|nr:LOW QUALITY PROTEIN: hypothetical protein PoB_001236700 [Plakobranchus ocellatus]
MKYGMKEELWKRFVRGLSNKDKMRQKLESKCLNGLPETSRRDYSESLPDNIEIQRGNKTSSRDYSESLPDNIEVQRGNKTSRRDYSGSLDVQRGNKTSRRDYSESLPDNTDVQRGDKTSRRDYSESLPDNIEVQRASPQQGDIKFSSSPSVLASAPVTRDRTHDRGISADI